MFLFYYLTDLPEKNVMFEVLFSDRQYGSLQLFSFPGLPHLCIVK